MRAEASRPRWRVVSLDANDGRHVGRRPGGDSSLVSQVDVDVIARIASRKSLPTANAGNRRGSRPSIGADGRRKYTG